MANDNGTLPLMDIHLSAFIQLQGVEPVLLKQSGRVVFAFPNTERVMSLIQEYNGNPVGIRLLDYIQHLRRLRSQMLAMRD
jgi:hypothetical protein